MLAAFPRPLASGVDLKPFSSQARHGTAGGHPVASRESRSRTVTCNASNEACKGVSKLRPFNFPPADIPHDWMKRRQALAIGAILLLPPTTPSAYAEEEAPLALIPYEDTKNQFSILRPETWETKSKSGAVVLFQDPDSRTNNIGIVINPVRISSLTEFGTIDVVADRLLKAELKKESTNSAGIVSMTESRLGEGTPLYQIEYHLDSTRGTKRVLTAVTITNKKLYIANATLAEPPSEVLLTSVKTILNSFDVVQ